VLLSGYHFVKWSGELVDNENDELLELNRVIRNMRITAHFAPDAVEFVSGDERLRIIVLEGTTALDVDSNPLTLVQSEIKVP
jgi:hypothetical protein